MSQPSRPSLAEQLWGALGVLISITAFFALVVAFPGFFEGSKDWGFLMVIVGGGTCMMLGARLMQRAYRRRHGLPR